MFGDAIGVVDWNLAMVAEYAPLISRLAKLHLRILTFDEMPLLAI
jgi:hypothetical protein